MRILNTVEAVREAHELILANGKENIVIGEGAPDPKCCFGTTRNLHKKFPDQVFDSPVSENGVAGICIGASLQGIKPIFIHMRQDFLLYAMDQIVNNAAKWHSMYGGNGGSVPIVIKAFTGRGWGAGHQHSQNLESLFAHIPGLKVLVPSSPRTAKGLLIAAVNDPNPCLILEDRWIHHLEGEVPEGSYETPIGIPEIVIRAPKEQNKVSRAIVTWGANVSMAVRAAKYLKENHDTGVSVIDLLTLSPINWETDLWREICCMADSFAIVCNEWEAGSFAQSIARQFYFYEDPPTILALPNFYPSSTPALVKDYYPTWQKIVAWAAYDKSPPADGLPHDIPDKSFVGPF